MPPPNPTIPSQPSPWVNNASFFQLFRGELWRQPWFGSVSHIPHPAIESFKTYSDPSYFSSPPPLPLWAKPPWSHIDYYSIFLRIFRELVWIVAKMGELVHEKPVWACWLALVQNCSCNFIFSHLSLFRPIIWKYVPLLHKGLHRLSVLLTKIILMPLTSAFLLLSPPLLPPSLGSLYCQHTDLTHWTLSPCSHLKALALGVPYAWNTFSSVLPEGYLHRCAKLYFYSCHLIYPWPAFSSQHLSLDILCNHLATCLFLPPPTSMKTPWDYGLCSSLCPQTLAQCLAHVRCSINICQMDDCFRDGVANLSWQSRSLL